MFFSYSLIQNYTVLKERIQEIFEFTKSESPYRKANKGWINQDIFLDLRPSSSSLKEKNEAAKVTFYWSPINNLLSNIFLIIIISSILVFTSISFVKGRFNLNFFNTSISKAIIQDDVNYVAKDNYIKDLDFINSNLETEQDFNKSDSDNQNKISSLDDNQVNSEQEIIKNQNLQQDTKIKDIENNKDINISKNTKTKSNFI